MRVQRDTAPLILSLPCENNKHMTTYKNPNPSVFETKVKTEFIYLVNEFSYSEPQLLNNEKEYRDRLLYTKENKAVEILNAWHPNDYGFEVNYYADCSLVNTANDNIPTHEMIYYKLKEEQDANLSFVAEGAEKLKKFLLGKGVG